VEPDVRNRVPEVQPMRGLFVLILIVAIAGCTDAPAATKAAGPTLSDAPAATVTADTGSIAGQVLGDDQLPIAGAEVAIVGTAAVAMADANGKFTFNELEPGDKTLAVGKLGYQSQSKRVAVVAGEATNVTFILSAVELLEPRVESFISNGFIQFATSVPSVYFSAAYNGANPVMGPTKESWTVNATQGAVAVVSTGTWQKSGAGSPTWMFLQAAATDLKESKQGSSALTVRLLGMNVAEKEAIKLVFGATFGCQAVTPTDCVDEPPNRLAQVAFQQKTTVYTDIFYLDPPAADHVATSKS
jgi:hypothetical protein